jgi:SsrA-binding protein
MATKSKESAAKGPRIVASNRKAHHDFHIEETLEAGIQLLGTEIKSVRVGQVNLREGFVLIKDGEAWLRQVHIAQYSHGNRENHEETRPRKLLLHKRQIQDLHSDATQRNWTIIPLRMYITEKGLAKVEIGLARGKKNYDKRQDIADRDSKRDIQRALKQRY